MLKTKDRSHPRCKLFILILIVTMFEKALSSALDTETNSGSGTPHFLYALVLKSPGEIKGPIQITLTDSNISVRTNASDELEVVSSPGQGSRTYSSNGPKGRYTQSTGTAGTSQASARVALNMPPRDEPARFARYVVKVSDWAAISTISSREPTEGYPFASVVAVSDSPPDDDSTGVPYLYLTPFAHYALDLDKNPKATLVMSLAQGDYCRTNSYDPQHPFCAYVMLSGSVVKVSNNSTDEAQARKSLFMRHPQFHRYPKSHRWFFGKLNVTSVLLQSAPGEPTQLTPDEYFADNMLRA